MPPVRYPATKLSRATGVPHATCSRLLKGRSERITIGLARRLLAVDGHTAALEEAA